MNGTYREIERRILSFRERTGRDYDAVWVAPERFQMLPEAVRTKAMGDAFRRVGPGYLTIAGVPVRILQVLATGQNATSGPGAGRHGSSRAWPPSAHPRRWPEPL